MKARLFTLVLILAFGHSQLTAQAISEKQLTDLDKFYKTETEKYDIAGSSLAMVQNGKTILHTIYGLTDLEEKTPVDRETIFHWASVTKTFTGIAIMQLRDRRLLSLDDPVTKYIPELRKVHNEFGSMDDITIRHLITHSSGFRNPTWPWDDADKQRWMPHEPQHWEQLAAMFPYTEINFEPGSRWSYSNPGLIFLGRIIELLTNDDYEYYVEKNILSPLGMHRSYFDKTPYHLLDNLSRSYYLQDDGSHTAARFDLNTGITASNGGLSAPLTDMMTYLNFLLGNSDESAYRHVLSRSSIGEMFEPQIAIAPDAYPYKNVTAQQMGLTFFVEDTNGSRLISHSGDQNGYISHIYLAPEKNIAYAVAYNTRGNTRELDYEIMQYITQNIFSGVDRIEN